MTTASSPDSLEQLLRIRTVLASTGARMRPETDLYTIERVLQRVGDPGLTLDALLMCPRPDWLQDMIGNQFKPA